MWSSVLYPSGLIIVDRLKFGRRPEIDFIFIDMQAANIHIMELLKFKKENLYRFGCILLITMNRLRIP